MTNSFRTHAILVAVLVIALGAVALRIEAQTPAWQSKVDPWVLETAFPGIETEFLVVLREQADLSAAAQLPTRAEKGRFVFEQLSAAASRSQGPLLAELTRRGIEHRPYWIVNMVWVRGDSRVVKALAQRSDVARLHANPEVPLLDPYSMDAPSIEPKAIGANINHTGAPAVFWANGFTGQGSVVAGADTGYDWDHPALINQYRGWNGASADHNYNWHDAIHSGGGVCGADTLAPCDDVNHGTHTMGTMVGDDGGSNQIGMAPGARWVGCRNMNVGNGTPTTYSECFQWFIAPTDLNDENPNPSLAPHVVNNSWSCPAFEGCTDPNVLRTVVENTRAAGIMVVVSAGNGGSGCSSVSTPAAIYDASFSIGATNNSDIIASFSSRGPVTVDGSNRLKPDVSAPGVSVRSCIPGTGYANFSGTSMSGPHVAGLAALIISAGPCLAGDVDGIEANIIDSAIGRTTTQSCGGIPGSEVPNNTYGYGAIRAALPDDCLASDHVLPESFSAQGALLSGTLDDLLASDDDRVVIRSAPMLGGADDPAVSITVEGSTTIMSPTELRFTYEGQTTVPGVSQRIYLFDFVANDYVLVGDQPATSGDSTVIVVVDSNAGDFVGAGGLLRARIGLVPSGPGFFTVWIQRVDLTAWDVTP